MKTQKKYARARKILKCNMGEDEERKREEPTKTSKITQPNLSHAEREKESAALAEKIVRKIFGELEMREKKYIFEERTVSFLFKYFLDFFPAKKISLVSF